MKIKLLIPIMGLILLFCGCKAHYPVAQEGGKEDVAFLLFESSKTYANKFVTVTLDDKTTFEAKVVKASDSNRKGSAYTTSTGRKKIQVKYNGQLLYNKEIFVSTQETKIITLP